MLTQQYVFKNTICFTMYKKWNTKKSQICQKMHQINHLNLGQQIELKEMIKKEEHMQVTILNLKLQC